MERFACGRVQLAEIKVHQAKIHKNGQTSTGYVLYALAKLFKSGRRLASISIKIGTFLTDAVVLKTWKVMNYSESVPLRSHHHNQPSPLELLEVKSLYGPEGTRGVCPKFLTQETESPLDFWLFQLPPKLLRPPWRTCARCTLSWRHWPLANKKAERLRQSSWERRMKHYLAVISDVYLFFSARPELYFAPTQRVPKILICFFGILHDRVIPWAVVYCMPTVSYYYVPMFMCFMFRAKKN